MGVEPKIGVWKPRKMDGLFHGKPYEQMDDSGGKNPYFWRATHMEAENGPLWKGASF